MIEEINIIIDWQTELFLELLLEVKVSSYDYDPKGAGDHHGKAAAQLQELPGEEDGAPGDVALTGPSGPHHLPVPHHLPHQRHRGHSPQY